MKRKSIIIAIAVITIAIFYLCRPKGAAQLEMPVSRDTPASATIQLSAEPPPSLTSTNALGDILTDAQNPEFANQVFPKFREFVATLDRLGVSPFQDEPQAGSCSKIQITKIPDGIMCRFVIGDGWSARYTQNPSFSGIVYFGQRGPDDPIRAISRANTNNLSRLSQSAITMPEDQVWTIANRVADAFRIDRSEFEKPAMHEEGLFDYRLGIYTVGYRKKDSDPVNGLNYTRGFSLKATSPTTVVLVGYSHLGATLK